MVNNIMIEINSCFNPESPSLSSTSGGFSMWGDIYHKYIGGYSAHRGDIMIHIGDMMTLGGADYITGLS